MISFYDLMTLLKDRKHPQKVRLNFFNKTAEYFYNGENGYTLTPKEEKKLEKNYKDKGTLIYILCKEEIKLLKNFMEESKRIHGEEFDLNKTSYRFTKLEDGTEVWYQFKAHEKNDGIFDYYLKDCFVDDDIFRECIEIL